MELTTEQLGKVIFKVEHESRRQAKRYLKQHGGTGRADELDAVLDQARADAQAVKHAERLAAERRSEEAQLLDLEQRAEVDRRARVIRLAAKCRWEAVVTIVLADAMALGWTDRWNETQRALIDLHGRASAEEIAAEIDVCAGDLIRFDADNLDAAWRDILAAVNTAQEEAAKQNAIKSIEARATPNGRFVIQSYYRKTMAPDRSCMLLAFDDRDDARAWTSLCAAGYKGSSYGVSLIDLEEEENVYAEAEEY